MKLSTLSLKNFRGYREAKISFDEDINVIIGKNDIGKSTIMEALEIFFNNGQVKIEISDLNVYTIEDKNIEICCEFSDCDDDIIIDSTNKTKLAEEYLLNEKGNLEIKKVWNCTKQKIGMADMSVYINAMYPKINEKPLVNMKITDLKKELDKVKDEIENYDEINKTKSADIRKALYEFYRGKDIQCERTSIDINKEAAKEIWTGINMYLPVFFLFKADRENIDSDSEVQNPLKVATRKVLQSIEPQLLEIKKMVEQSVKEIANNTLEKLSEMDVDIASSLQTCLNTKPWDSIFSFELEDESGIPLNKRGSGIRRLILLSYFRAEAERIIKDGNKENIIYAIEEPETSQHPDYQRMIMESLQAIANDDKHQIILTTHTPEIAKMIKPNQVIFITRNDDRCPIIEDGDDKIKHVIQILGILPNATSKVILCVEGETDVSFIKNISKISYFRDIIDLEKENISIIAMKGSNLVSWINKDYFKESNVKEIHLYDSDVPEYAEKIKEINESPDDRRWGFITKRLEIENYIPKEYIQEQFDVLLEYSEEEWKNIDIPKMLMEKIGQSKKLKEIQIKGILDGHVSKKITYDDLVRIGAVDEIESWFSKIKEINNM